MEETKGFRKGDPGLSCQSVARSMQDCRKLGGFLCLSFPICGIRKGSVEKRERQLHFLGSLVYLKQKWILNYSRD